MNRVLTISMSALALVALASCKKEATTAASTLCKDQPAAETNLKPADFTGLRTKTLKDGKGLEVLNGDTITVEYIGRLADGTEFDSSCKEGGNPLPFMVGEGGMVSGFEGGVLTMKLGETRRIYLPANLAYGYKESPGIPANSPLIFDVQVLEIKKPQQD